MLESKLDTSSINVIIDEFIEAYKQKIQSSGHSASGNLIKSISKRVEFDGQSFRVFLHVPLYAIFLENGTRPHFPPVDAILKWIEIKPILPRPLANGKLPTNKQLAFLIARKISKVGTPATNMISDTMNEFQVVKKLKSEFRRAYISKIIEEIKNGK